MRYRAGKRGKSHDKYARADRGFQLIAEHCGEDKQHHHAAACADESADKPDYRSADNGLYRTLFRRDFFHRLFCRHDWADDEFYSEQECHYDREAAHRCRREQAREIAADDCEREDGRHHNESVFYIEVLFLAVCIRRDGAREHI